MMYGEYTTKTLKCKECQEDVVLNDSYPIDEVTCQRCYIIKKREKGNASS